MFLGYFSEFISNNKDGVITLLINRIKCKKLMGELLKYSTFVDHYLRIII